MPVLLGEVEVLQLGRHEEGETEAPCPLQGPPQHVAGVAFERGAVEVDHVAHHPGDRRAVGQVGEELEGLGVGHGQDVALLDPAEAVDGRPVEGHALLEGVLQLGRRDLERLGGAEHVGEPHLDEPHAPFLDRPQHVVLLAFHRRHDRWPARRPLAGAQICHKLFTRSERPCNTSPPC